MNELMIKILELLGFEKREDPELEAWYLKQWPNDEGDNCESHAFLQYKGRYEELPVIIVADINITEGDTFDDIDFSECIELSSWILTHERFED